MMHESHIKEILPISKILIKNPYSDLVVTLSKNGDALSVFSDDIWDYSATSISPKTINFTYKIQSISMLDVSSSKFNLAVKFLKIFALNWVCQVNGCSISKLTSDLTAISFLIVYVIDNNLETTNVFEDPSAIDFLISNNCKEKRIGLLLGKIQRFIDTASVLNKDNYWSNLQPSKEFLKKLIDKKRVFPESTQSIQTLIIPSRIYQSLLKQTIEDLQIFNENQESIAYIFSVRSRIRDQVIDVSEAVTAGKLNNSQQALIRYYWKKALLSDKKLANSLLDLQKLNIINNANWLSLTISLGQIQIKSALIIAAFTGMRKNEVLSIPFNGLKYIHSDKGEIPVIWSTTTKLESNGVPRFTKWVTGSVVEDAFKAAQLVTRGALCWSGNKSEIVPDESKLPLFFSIEKGKSGEPHPYFDYSTTAFNTSLLKAIMHSSEHLLVTEQDLKEISHFLYGDEISSKVQIAKPWPLSFHQFRRSMAVYAASSGYVSYPTLKAQLKHISMVMTAYYTDSNSRAINILGDGSEIEAMRKEWQDAKARAESDNLHGLLNSDVTLAGAAGKSLHTKKVQSKLPRYLENRRNTKKAVKNGKIRYRTTLVGGCMSLKPCDKGAGVLASACISCVNAVFLPESTSSLLQTKKFYESQITLDIPKRVHREYETSIKQIDSLLSVLVLE
ncbi:hypothetical protein [Psychrobacter sp.]|uniref:hypothetical protein n=1 Tax=Psychrobacter sp. TaxID=56811 RepID=UPI0025CC7648|nr:hypothetical protein [Psychrobacter sp.]